jgi:hypothetical protein
MALLELQTRTDGSAHYTMRTKLDGTDYEFEFRFSERRGGWTFDLRTLDNVEVITGQLVIISDKNLLRRSTVAEKPPGTLFARNLQSDDSGRLRELPGLTDLGPEARCRLYYKEAAE